MVWFRPEHGRIFGRIVIVILCGWLMSWLGVGALIALSFARPHDPVPRVLLAVWAVLAAVSFAIPGAFRGKIGGRLPLLFLAVPFMPFARAAVAIWPHLPEAIRNFLEGGSRSRRWAKTAGRTRAFADDEEFLAHLDAPDDEAGG
jgi:hypothetical protein